MDWQTVVAKVIDLAPAAGATFGGPLGAGAGLAIKTIAQMFGVKGPDPKPEEIMAAIQADPAAGIKLEMARMDYNREMERIASEDRDKQRDDALAEIKAILGDVQNARQREIEIIKATGKDWDKRFLTILGSVAPLGVLAYIVIDGFPTLSTEITLLVGNLIGILFAKYSTIFDYHLGTSSKK